MMLSVMLSTSRISMQARTFEEPVAISRFDLHLESAAVSVDRERHFDAGFPERPDFSKQCGELADARPRHGHNDVAAVQVRLLGRPALCQADKHQAVLD